MHNRTRRFLDLVGCDVPIIQAPMANSQGSALAIAVANAGGLGSLPCATISHSEMRAELELIRQQTARPVNLNFFCHTPPKPDPDAEARWRAALAPLYAEHGIDPASITGGASRAPFDAEYCALVEAYKPKVVSFHFGLPAVDLLARVKAAGCIVLSSATTVAEARWLEAHGCDVIIAQGFEAGGHRGVFLDEDPIAAMSSQPGTFALVPQVADAVAVPVIAAGGIADGRGIAAALILGASAAQIGTAFLGCPEAKTSAVHRAALKSARDDQTAATNIFTGRPARGLMNGAMRTLGPLTRAAPAFPLATAAIQPLRTKHEAAGSGDFSPLWSGQAAALARHDVPAAELVASLMADAERALAKA